jgi:hypothetical protein
MLRQGKAGLPVANGLEKVRVLREDRSGQSDSASNQSHCEVVPRYFRLHAAPPQALRMVSLTCCKSQLNPRRSKHVTRRLPFHYTYQNVFSSLCHTTACMHAHRVCELDVCSKEESSSSSTSWRHRRRVVKRAQLTSELHTQGHKDWTPCS